MHSPFDLSSVFFFSFHHYYFIPSHRTKAIKNRPLRNEELSEEDFRELLQQKEKMIQKQQQQIAALQMRLKQALTQQTITSPPQTPQTVPSQSPLTISVAAVAATTTPMKSSHRSAPPTVISTPTSDAASTAVEIDNSYLSTLKSQIMRATIPIDFSHFLCPLSGSLLQEAVIASDGFTYSRQALLEWMNEHRRSPLTNTTLSGTVHPNYQVRRLIAQYRRELIDASSNRFVLLPLDIVENEILALLDPVTLASCALVCRWFRTMCSRTSLWRRKLQIDYAFPSTVATPAADQRPQETYIKLWTRAQGAKWKKISSKPMTISSGGLSLLSH
jgi:hypothetical protein